MKGNGESIDLSKMKLLKMPEKQRGSLEVRVNTKGELVLNTTLCKKIMDDQDRMYVKFYYSEDYRTIAIQRNDEKDFYFPKSGKMKYQEYANKLELLGYKLPAIYKVFWHEDIQAWGGTLQEVLQAPTAIRTRRKSVKE